MSETPIPDYPRGITFEQVWAGLMENRKHLEETDRLIKETAAQMKENDRQLTKQMRENDRRLTRQMRETDRRMGYLGNRFGELAEHLVAPGIKERFNEQGYHFEIVATRGCKVWDSNGEVRAEIDILLENAEIIIAVEVKSKPVVKDVEHHIRRLEILRDARDKLHDKRKIMGAIAGAIFGTEEKDATRQAGLYVIEQSGDTMKINMPHDFVPGEW